MEPELLRADPARTRVPVHVGAVVTAGRAAHRLAPTQEGRPS